ncbi:hypothetical protein ACHQM5_001071 [Ranunculus cassubicifolius]
METETSVLEKCNLDLASYIGDESNEIRHSWLKTLASVRGLIVNRSTSDRTVSCIIEILVRSLQNDKEAHHHLVLKLLGDLALQRDLSHVIVDKVFEYVSAREDASLLTAKALAVFLTAAEPRGSLSTSYKAEIIDNFFHLLCLSPSVCVRSWILSNSKRFHVPTYRLATIFLKFTSDPYAFVRRAALEGLISLEELKNVKQRGLIHRCYDRAVELLLDTNDCVRSVAVHAVRDLGHMLATLVDEDATMDWFDAVFIRLCAMVRDMSVEVRIEAFASLGDTKLVSEDILLQTLSKKSTDSIKDRKITGLCTSNDFELPAMNVAGVFIHGFEDEFNEVRKAACICLGKLTILSVQFAEDVLNLLVDTLNDDVMAVRLQCLEIMHHMATSDRLKLQQAHLHMFLGTLVDSNTLIRNTARKIIRLIKLKNLNIFKTVINDLLTNLESYAEDETDIFNVLFNIGMGHGRFSVKFLMENIQDIQPSCKGELHFDRARVPAILILAIGASLKLEEVNCRIPTEIFNYAVPFLGRISYSIRDVMSQDTLFTYLSNRCTSIDMPISEIFRHEEPCRCALEPCVSVTVDIDGDREIINKVRPLHQICYGNPEDHHQNLLVLQMEKTNATGLILTKVTEIWPLIRSGCLDEVRRLVRSCKEELASISAECDRSRDMLTFACQYLQVVSLLGKVWEYVFPPRKGHGGRSVPLDYLFEKLDMNITRMRYAFVGFTLDLELHILEFELVACVLRLLKGGIIGRVSNYKKLHATVSYIESLCAQGCMELSDFSKEVKLLSQEKSSDNDALKRSIKIFYLKNNVFGETLKHIKADVDVPGNDSENPLPFISGLPAAITFQVTVHNLPSQDRLWLKMSVEEIVQYVFLDHCLFEEYGCFKRVSLTVPFYNTRKSASFSVRACLGKECPFGDVQLGKGGGGPKEKLAILCNDKEIYFVRRY